MKGLIQSDIMRFSDTCETIEGTSDHIQVPRSVSMPSSTTDQSITNDVMKSLGKIGNSVVRMIISVDDLYPQSHCYNGKCTCF